MPDRQEFQQHSEILRHYLLARFKREFPDGNVNCMNCLVTTEGMREMKISFPAVTMEKQIDLIKSLARDLDDATNRFEVSGYSHEAGSPVSGITLVCNPVSVCRKIAQSDPAAYGLLLQRQLEEEKTRSQASWLHAFR